MNLIAHILGLDDVGGPFYAFWSGVGLSIFWPVVYYYQHTCHYKWSCFRIGKHEFHHYKLCKKHHPKINNSKPASLQIANLHKADK